MEESSSSRNGIAQIDSDTETGKPCQTSIGEPDVATQVLESHVDDELDMLAGGDGGHMPWCPLFPFFTLLAYVLEKTGYRNVQLKKFDSTEDQSEH